MICMHTRATYVYICGDVQDMSISTKKKRSKKTAENDSRDIAGDAEDHDGPVYFDAEEEKLRKKEAESEKRRAEAEVRVLIN